MELKVLKDKFEEAAIATGLSFDYGDIFDRTATAEDVFPMVFLELPMYISYNHINKKRVTFAINLLSDGDFDSLNDDFIIMSDLEIKAQEYINYIKLNYYTEFIIEYSILSGLTIRNITDSDLAGIRFDITVLTDTDLC